MKVNCPHTLEQYQKARISRDSRFDGQFFIAVKTTRIFCRPVCPANLPKEQNVEYYENKVSALQAGYRPCLRCRPDSAPNSFAWRGSETTFSRAVRLIDSGAMNNESVNQLSERLGISDRYLRKLFDDHLSMSPKHYANYQRLLFAKQLLHHSDLPITQIAFASGFQSVRRFNDAFKKHLALTPSQVRNKKVGGENLVLLRYRGNYDWQHMMDFLALRSINGVETVENGIYRRILSEPDMTGWFELFYLKAGQIGLRFELKQVAQLQNLISRVRRLFDIDANIEQIERDLSKVNKDLVKRSGIRLPGVWNSWEAGVRAVLGQQVSIKAAITHLNGLVENVNQQYSQSCCFPSAQQVAKADLDFLRMPKSRIETLKRLAEFCSENPSADPQQWLELKGIGPWTVNYAKLRSQSDPTLLLEGDLVVKKARKHFPELTSENVAPWGSYATFHLWSHAQ